MSNDRLKFVRTNSTEGFFTGEVNGRRVLVPVTDNMPLDAEGMKAIVGEETQVQENIRNGLTVEGKQKKPATWNLSQISDPEGRTQIFP
ncbi:MAG: hypothetical protein WC069_04305 [Candidatus Shapirobacteria bacterium]